MCNISGYIGDRRAAPVLIDMMKRQEGYCGGYYTGITTLHDGKLYTRKVLGDIARLIAETDAMDLPGNVGVLHSRSNSGGDVRWGHPFVTEDNKFSLSLNGIAGKYKIPNESERIARMLEREGVKFDTASNPTDRINKSPRLENGKCVHTSEVVCQLAYYLKNKFNLPTYLALERTFLDFPKEAVVLALHADELGMISYAKMNMPMAISRTETEVFLSSFSICFPEDRSYISHDELPQESSGQITLDTLNIHRFKSPKSMGRMTPTMMHDAYDIILNTLCENGPTTIGKFNSEVSGLWGEDVDIRYLATYPILQDLYSSGRIKILTKLVSGPVEANDPDMKIPQFTVALKDYEDDPERDNEIDDNGAHCDTR